LERYRHREGEILKKLREKYLVGNNTSTQSIANGPRCYLEIEINGIKAGHIEICLNAEKVPVDAENFRELCTSEIISKTTGAPLCYKNNSIHQIVPNFCIQCGDITNGDGTGGVSIYSQESGLGDMWGKFKDELFLPHSCTVLLSMANNGPNQNGSQFFFTIRPTPHLDNKHVVFGKIIDGMQVIN
jgi:cyclophilin family peptidyl-prolyl cis-trans isomerase